MHAFLFFFISFDIETAITCTIRMDYSVIVTVLLCFTDSCMTRGDCMFVHRPLLYSINTRRILLYFFSSFLLEYHLLEHSH
jgi:hypothetical protein